MINLNFSIFRENIFGSFLMVLSMAAFAAEDSIIKTLSQTLPLSQIIFILGVGGAFLFLCVGLLLRKEIWRSEVLSLPMHIRVISEIFGRIFYSLALALTSFVSATIILQATPLVVVIGASFFFGEKVGALRWTAILVGFIGVFLIVNPGLDSFSTLSFLAVLGMLGFAARDLASRGAPKELNIFSLGVHGFVSLAIAGIVLSFFLDQGFELLDFDVCLELFLGILFGCIGYASLITAMRIGEVSVISPFRYTRLIFGLSIGVFIFGETIGISAIFGCVLIVFSSLVVLYSNRGRSNT